MPRRKCDSQWFTGIRFLCLAFLFFLLITPTVHSFGRVLAQREVPTVHLLSSRELRRHLHQQSLRPPIRYSDYLLKSIRSRRPCRDLLVVLRAGRNDEAEHLPRKSGGESLILVTAGSLISVCMAAAATGVLPGYVFESSSSSGVDWITLLRDVVATVVTSSLGYGFVQLITWAVSAGRFEPRDARKIIHTLSAPLFMLLWPIFSASPGARVFASIVPALNAVRLFLAGSSNQAESALATAVSRSGDVKEAVGGPFIYVCMLAASILLFWRDSPTGIVAMSSLAAGDGMADLIGRRYGVNNQWPGTKKSIAGTAAFWLSSTVTATGLLAWMQYTGCLEIPGGLPEAAGIVAGITLVSALLEIIPWFGDDNYTVPLSAALLSVLFLHGS